MPRKRALSKSMLVSYKEHKVDSELVGHKRAQESLLVINPSISKNLDFSGIEFSPICISKFF